MSLAPARTLLRRAWSTPERFRLATPPSTSAASRSGSISRDYNAQPAL